ncbi:acyltransferase [Agrobacterium cavarae]|uniref:Acyltransferase n=1 Tax=Agrobacterium cavarae TaxID=2528239 RepID=A0ABY1YBH9_9HYPH|nr:acyltransferase [Agrobacterium cavarae]
MVSERDAACWGSFVIKKTLNKAIVHGLYYVSCLLPPDPVSNRARAYFYKLSGGRRFGKNVAILPFVYINSGKLTLGDNVYLNQRCYIDLSAEVTIGANVKVGPGVSFVTANHEIGDSSTRCGNVKPAPIVVGDGAWIGANAVLLGGCKIGRGAIVAAGAVVTKDVAPDTMVGGVPARLIRDLQREKDATDTSSHLAQ